MYSQFSMYNIFPFWVPFSKLWFDILKELLALIKTENWLPDLKTQGFSWIKISDHWKSDSRILHMTSKIFWYGDFQSSPKLDHGELL